MLSPRANLAEFSCHTQIRSEMFVIDKPDIKFVLVLNPSPYVQRLVSANSGRTEILDNVSENFFHGKKKPKARKKKKKKDNNGTNR